MTETLLRYYASKELLGKTLTEFELVKNDGLPKSSKHQEQTGCLQMLVVLEGLYVIEIGKKPFELRPQSGVVFHCNSKLDIALSDRSIGSFYALKFNIAESKNGFIRSYMVKSQKPFLSKKTDFLIYDEGYGRDILQLCKIIHQEKKITLTGSELIEEAAVMGIIGKLFRLSAMNASTKDFRQKLSLPFISLVDTINQKIDHKWTVGEMANVVGMSHTRFHEQSKTHTGYSPIHLLMVLRIERAKEMLIKSDQSITEIAFSTGFASSQHFATTFQKLAKSTPRNYRKRHKLLPNQNYLSG